MSNNKKLSILLRGIIAENPVLVLVLGAFGFVNMWLAVFADVGVVMIAILNSMRALFHKRIKRI